MLRLEYCSYFVLSPLRTSLELLIVPSLFLAYLPQYIKIYKFGTTGISSRFIVYLCLFGTLQLASRFINLAGIGAVDCILYRKELYGIKAFSALIGYFQVLSQWFCVIIWLYIFLRFRSAKQDSVYTPLLADRDGDRTIENNTSSSKTGVSYIFFDNITFMVFAHAFFFLGTTFWMLVAQRESGQRGPGGPLLQDMATFALGIFCTLAGLLQVTILGVAQIKDAWAYPRANSISILSLVVQIAVLLVLAFLQLSRPYAPLGPSWRTEFWGLYFDHWAISINYFIMISGCIISLFIRILG